MTVYHGAGGMRAPVEVQCSEKSWDRLQEAGACDLDSAGNRMFSNTHFATLAEAWVNVLQNAQASLSIGARHVVAARAAVLDAEKRCADYAIEFAAVTEGYNRWSIG